MITALQSFMSARNAQDYMPEVHVVMHPIKDGCIEKGHLQHADATGLYMKMLHPTTHDVVALFIPMHSISQIFYIRTPATQVRPE